MFDKGGNPEIMLGSQVAASGLKAPLQEAKGQINTNLTDFECLSPTVNHLANNVRTENKGDVRHVTAHTVLDADHT